MEFTDTTTPSFDQWKNAGSTAWRDRTRDAYNTWAQMYYPNAFQVAMLNYQNEYAKPINQMLRYQEAGLNPYSFESQQSASGSQGASPTPSFGNQELSQKKVQNVLQGVNSLSGALGVAKDLYDYIRFGRERSLQQTQLSVHQTEAAKYAADIKEQEAAWSRYWNGAVPNKYFDPDLQDYVYSSTKYVSPDSPRAKYMQASTNRINKQIAQLSYMIEFLYPSQTAANEARAALMNYQKEVMAGHNDAVLNLNTGNKTADSILKFLLYLLTENLPTIGFSAKL